MLNEFYLSFYLSQPSREGKKKVKTVPLDLSLLTPLALAHLVMQDGARGSSKGLYLCTFAFAAALLRNSNSSCAKAIAGVSQLLRKSKSR
jgi:LAGLIDADG DNA endonuclease family